MLRLWLGESTQAGESARAPAFVSDGQRVRYLVTRQEDVWFINFAGEKFGPYISEREAMLFAVDAAQKLGANGEDTEVCRVEELGSVLAALGYLKGIPSALRSARACPPSAVSLQTKYPGKITLKGGAPHSNMAASMYCSANSDWLQSGG